MCLESNITPLAIWTRPARAGEISGPDTPLFRSPIGLSGFGRTGLSQATRWIAISPSPPWCRGYAGCPRCPRRGSDCGCGVPAAVCLDSFLNCGGDAAATERGFMVLLHNQLKTGYGLGKGREKSKIVDIGGLPIYNTVIRSRGRGRICSFLGGFAYNTEVLLTGVSYRGKLDNSTQI